MTFCILNIGIDRDLLDPAGTTEAQHRQRLYAQGLPASITHIVKAPRGASHAAPAYAEEAMQVWACPVSHFSLFPWKAIRLASRLARERPFDVLVAQEPVLSGIAAACVARRSKLPLVVGAYSDEIGNAEWQRERLVNRLFLEPVGRAVYRRADVIRADSRDVAGRLRQLGLPRVTFVPFLITNAAAIAQPSAGAAALREQLLEGGAGPLLLSISRLEAVKDIPMLLAAFQRIRQSMPGAVLAIAGDGTQRDALHRHARAIGVANVRWLGWRATPDIPALYHAADVFLLASRQESSARVLSECMLAGVPVVTTDTAGAAEVIEDGASGLITRVGDADAFAAAAINLLMDAERLAAMSRRAREVAARTVSSDAVIDGLRAMYTSVVGDQ